MQTKTYLFFGPPHYSCDWCERALTRNDKGEWLGVGIRYSPLFGFCSSICVSSVTAKHHLCLRCASDLSRALSRAR